MDADERIRREAVRRVLAGERAADVAGSLGRTERWVFRWLSRYDPRTADWATARSRAPHTIPNRTEPQLEALVLRVRARLHVNPWAQIGAAAVAWELEKLRLRQLPASERFRGLGHLARRLGRFEAFHNTHHRYAALGRATPEEYAVRLGFEPRLLEPDFQIPAQRPRRGRIEFIRLIRSDRLLHVLDEHIVLGPDLVHEYVIAILHVRRSELEVVHAGRVVKRLDFALRD